MVRHAQEPLTASVALVFALAPIAASAEENFGMPNHYPSLLFRSR
jgi:hypothetical protein